jgi:hypothetical protein
MFLEAKVMFHMYKPAQFVTYAGRFLDLKKEAKSVERAATELREIESQRKLSTAALLGLQNYKPDYASLAAIAAHLPDYRPDYTSLAAIAARLPDYKLDHASLAAIAAHLPDYRPDYTSLAAIAARLPDYKLDYAELAAIAAQFASIKPKPSAPPSALPPESAKGPDAMNEIRAEGSAASSHEDEIKDKPLKNSRDAHSEERKTGEPSTGSPTTKDD